MKTRCRHASRCRILLAVGKMDAVAARVASGETVRFRPTGSSMVPLIRSHQIEGKRR
ncbi:MAG TPA: hypothetical protein VGD48_06285 [Kutzneria sp.]